MELGGRAPIPLMKRVRRLDKPVDELARGKAMEKVLILFFVKTVRFNKKASRKARCQFCAPGHKTRLIGLRRAFGAIKRL